MNKIKQQKLRDGLKVRVDCAREVVRDGEGRW